jgi:hypothetical protein
LGGAWAAPADAAPTFTQVAREFVNGVGFLDPDVPVALSNDGRVAFSAKSIPANVDGLFAWQSGTLTPINLAAGGYTQVSSVAVNSAGDLALVARREAGITDFFGVYRTTTAGGAISTLREEAVGGTPKPRFVALSENGTVAFSTIVNGSGAIYRGPIAGVQPVLRSGSGTFFNTQRLDVNDAGQVAVQMEHTRPFGGLGRGILVFETPEQPLTDNKTAFEQVGVGVQPMPSINSAGQVAFSLNTSATLTFYDPPNVFGGTVVDTVNLTPGVYVTTPAGYGLPRTFTQVANNAGAFNTFGDRVLINDNGTVVFQAGLDGGGGGIYAGGDPVADKVIAQADLIGPTFVSFLALGDLNNAAQITFITSDFITTDRQVWIATLPEPAPGLIAAALLVASLAVRRDGRD